MIYKKKSFWFIVVWLTLIIIGVVNIVKNETADIDERTEEGEISFLTFTPNTLRQIYQDKWHVRPRKISGKLRLPPGDGPFPAVVFLHGHFHPDKFKYWFKDLVPRLLEAGVATFVIDSFTGRGIPETIGNPAMLSRAARLVDAFMGLNLLASLPEIDEERIGINAYSTGGTIALISADKRFIDTGLARGRSFAAHLSVYPDCQPQLRTLSLSKIMVMSPLLMVKPQHNLAGRSTWKLYTGNVEKVRQISLKIAKSARIQ